MAVKNQHAFETLATNHGTRGLWREIHFLVLGLDNFLKNPSLSSSSITLSSRNCPRLISPFTSAPWRTSSRGLLMPPWSTRGGKGNFGTYKLYVSSRLFRPVCFSRWLYTFIYICVLVLYSFI